MCHNLALTVLYDLALTVLYVPYSLDIGRVEGIQTTPGQAVFGRPRAARFRARSHERLYKCINERLYKRATLQSMHLVGLSRDVLRRWDSVQELPQLGKNKTVKARFWPLLEPFSDKPPENVSSCSLFARKRTWSG